MSNWKDRIRQRVEGWLFSEEIEQAREQREQSGVRPEQREEMARQLSELLSRMSSEVEHVKRQVELCKTEDHSQPPSQEDVDRYFEYHTNYVNNIKGAQEQGGMWVTEEKSTIEQTEYNSKAQSEGWTFLRDSCGMPQGDLNQKPWKDAGPEWSTETQQTQQGWDSRE